MKKPYTFIMKCGYVESEDIYSFAFSSRASGEKYANAKEALLDFASWLKERLLDKLNKEHSDKACCRATKVQISNARFCSRCGRPVEAEEPDPELLQQFIIDLSSANNDNLTDFIEWDDEARWQVEDIGTAFSSKATHVRFIYQAELVLTVAAGWSEGYKTIEKIFSQRTEEGSNSFSYW